MDVVQIQKLKNDLKLVAEEFENSEFYFDINLFDKEDVRILCDKENTDINKATDKGIKIRVWDNEKFLESATTNLEASNVRSILSELLESAKLNQRDLVKPRQLEEPSERLDKDFIIDMPKSLSLEEKKNKINTIKSEILKLDDNIINVRVGIIEEREKHLFVSKSRTLYQQVPVILLITVAYIKCEDGVTRMVYESYCDNNYSVIDKFEEEKDKFAKKIAKRKNVKKLKGGKYKVILSPKITGLLAHESFGHGMEADTMIKDRALATKWIGKKIGGEKINIVDYPAIEGKHGTFYFDSEGNLSRKVYLVKEGIINEPLKDLYSKANGQLGGNSRFESFDHKNYVRMSNTYFEPGDNELKDMIKSIDEGILIYDASGGMEDPKSWGVQIQGCFGERISNGELTGEFYDGFSFTGFLPDIIGNIEAISKEFKIEGGGMCGKGHKEWVRVSDGGPYLAIKEVLLG